MSVNAVSEIKSLLKKIDLSDQKKVGKISDAHGIQGWLYVLIFSGDVSWLDDLEKMYLKIKNDFYELQVLQARPHKKGFICSVQEIKNRNQSELLVGAEVWVDEHLFVSEDGESIYLSEILNFEVSDQDIGLIGHIESFSSNGFQDLLVVRRQQSEQFVEIPFVQEFVQKIDYKKNKILMKLPEGLLHINDPE